MPEDAGRPRRCRPGRSGIPVHAAGAGDERRHRRPSGASASRPTGVARQLGPRQRVDPRPARVPGDRSSRSPSSSSRPTAPRASRASRSPWLPLALAAVAQAIVVISGGIDLSIGSMMALTSVVAASLMKGQSEEFSVVVVIGGPAPRPRARGRQWRPGRRSPASPTSSSPWPCRSCGRAVRCSSSSHPAAPPPPGSRTWSTGSVVSEWIPRPAVVLIVIVAVDLDPAPPVAARPVDLRDRQQPARAPSAAACSVGRTKIAAYVLTGLFAALGGLALTASTGTGRPLPGGYTLLSVAAVVLGGVSLAGGRGGVVGPIIAVMILAADPDGHDVPAASTPTSRRSPRARS